MTTWRFHSFERFTLPFLEPQKILQQTLTHKRGSYLLLQNDDGQMIKGEVPCLPGFLPLDLDQVENQIQETLSQPFKLNQDWDWKRPFWGHDIQKPSSTQALFAIESALFSLIATDKELSVKRTRLVTNTKALSTISDLSQASFIKLKINRLPIDQEIEQVLTCIRKYPLLKWRLDANLSLTYDQLEKWWEALKSVKKVVQFFEEPNAQFKSFEEIPIARDESLNETNIAEENNYCVIKPTLHFGIVKTHQFLQQFPKRIILSSTYETTVGLSPLFHLAQLSEMAPGFDTISTLPPSQKIILSADKIILKTV
ncbi:MAG: hypothetical protein COW00_18905 [Bdellovibrio sp. CG12_big_fil_rev_8_21_14_0_65_39_13]|nr:MAG: hypothetical protein COW78_05975 [Bdellovibrio sp. CG22_combo_CG10-13_8_21_14_all_39_27]PIQ57768.1 MAG: hypothetical protein COW00_18905 [Bdellovibrio sp. CG12_big_fil_rev_8_21_14_0_65_39_13]PIR34999.1 MAG: hypothetical protein COV37_11000 [Bdellovibrio sp. CG11_big_fil_rev_8_21_14_0_20_39_38]